jgi:hypothetical protein
MPSWMPGDDYYTNFRVGDPYVKVDQGFARLPGAGYAALHPELKDVNPEDYPDINKMSILADVAPYSREYNTYRLKVGKQAQGNTELQIEYEKILDRVRQTKESVVRMAHRHFTEPVDEIEGTVDSVSPGGLTLKEFPGRKFQFSSVGMSAADMTARIIGEQNKMTREDAAREVDRRRGELRKYLTRCLRPAGQHKTRAHAPVMAGIPALPISELACSDRHISWGDRKALEACQRRRYIMFPIGVLILSCTFSQLPLPLQDKTATSIGALVENL